MTTRDVRILPIALVTGAMLMLWGLLAQAGGYGFSPPSGWRAQRPPAGYAGLWLNPNAQEAVNFVTTPATSLTNLVSRQIQKSLAVYPSMHLYSNVPYHVCGRHEGRYLIWTSSSHAAQWIHEQVIANWQGNGYVASYVRPASYTPNRAARASISSMCGVAGGSLNNPSAPYAAPPPPPQNQPQISPATPTAPTPYGYPSLYPRYAPVIPM